MKKIALITGISGQDGSYLAELLLSKDYEVHGIIRRSSSFNTGRIEHLMLNPEIYNKSLFLHYGDLTDYTSLYYLISSFKPDEIYNLGAQSHVRVSFDMPVFTGETVGSGTLNLLEAIRTYQDSTGNGIRYYQASSSEMFGKVQEVPQKETTPFYPRSPYGCAKTYAHYLTVNYRSLMISMLRVGFYLITKAQGVERHLLHEKSQGRLEEYIMVCKRSCIWEI